MSALNEKYFDGACTIANAHDAVQATAGTTATTQIMPWSCYHHIPEAIKFYIRATTRLKLGCDSSRTCKM